MSPDIIATLEQAAALAELDEYEILWAIDVYGVCSTDAFEILPGTDDDHYCVVRRPR